MLGTRGQFEKGVKPSAALPLHTLRDHVEHVLAVTPQQGAVYILECFALFSRLLHGDVVARARLSVGVEA